MHAFFSRKGILSFPEILEMVYNKKKILKNHWHSLSFICLQEGSHYSFFVLQGKGVFPLWVV